VIKLNKRGGGVIWPFIAGIILTIVVFMTVLVVMKETTGYPPSKADWSWLGTKICANAGQHFSKWSADSLTIGCIDASNNSIVWYDFVAESYSIEALKKE
jgi:hypothetical protein